MVQRIESTVVLKACPDASVGRGKWNRYESDLQERLQARTKVSAANNPIERIYLMKSSQPEDCLNRDLQKRAGLVIDGKIYWLEASISYLWELNNILDSLGVSVADNGEWGFWEGNRAPLRSSVTVLQESHQEVFAADSNYMINTQLLEDGYPWWNVKAIKQLIFNPIEDQEIKKSNLGSRTMVC